MNGTGLRVRINRSIVSEFARDWRGTITGFSADKRAIVHWDHMNTHDPDDSVNAYFVFQLELLSPLEHLAEIE